MTDEWTLSDKESLFYNEDGDEEANCYVDADVKEFIKRLKDFIKDADLNIEDIWDINKDDAKTIMVKEIDKLAGEKLA